MIPLRAIHVGAGGRGRWPIRRFAEREDFVSVALVDVSEENLVAAREVTGLGPEACFPTLARALESGTQADIAVVITPPDLHADQCLEAVRAGKHVLVEKPFTKSLSRAGQIVEAAEAAGLKIAVCQNARYAAASVTVERLIREGVYGAAAFGLMTKFGWRPGTHHSGADRHAYLWERAIHDFDAVRFMLGADPLWVWGHSFNPPWSPYAGGGGVHAWIEFSGGVTFGFLCTFASHGKGSELRIDCEGGSIEPCGEGLRLQLPGVAEAEIIPLDEAPHPETVLLDGFRDYIRDGVEPSFSGRRNLVTIAMVEAVGVASDGGVVLDFEDFMQSQHVR